MHIEIESLVGETIASVTHVENDEKIVFHFNSGRIVKMYHDQDCCEDVRIEDITGDLQSLVGETIREIDQSFGEIVGEGVDRGERTTFTITTDRRSIQIIWKGFSNGYYGTSANLYEDSMPITPAVRVPVQDRESDETSKEFTIDVETLRRVIQEGHAYPYWDRFVEVVQETVRPLSSQATFRELSPKDAVEDLIVSTILASPRLDTCPEEHLVSMFWNRLRRLSSLQNPGSGYVEVVRLKKLVDPFHSLRVTPKMIFDWKGEVSDFVEMDKRRQDYHLPRIKYFLEHHEEIDRNPIELDFHYGPGPGVVPQSADLIDGHHRMIAAILLGKILIPLDFSGPMEILYWLMGFGSIDRVPYDLA